MMKTKKQFIFKNRSDAEQYLEEISKLIRPIFKKIPSFSEYKDLPELGKPLEKKVNDILSEYLGVVGSDGYAVLGNRSLSPLTKLRVNSCTNQQEVSIPVDFSIWACFGHGYVNFTFSNIFNNEKITNEYFNYSGPRSGSGSRPYFILEKVYDRIQANYGVSSVRRYKETVFFKRLSQDPNTETPEQYLAA